MPLQTTPPPADQREGDGVHRDPPDSLVSWMIRPDPFEGMAIPPGAERVKLLGIYYLHFKMPDGGDLYVTKFGQTYLEQLKLQNWHEKEWFRAHREKLMGTSTVYKVRSKEVDGRSINLVVKWCRVGEDVPLDTMGFNRFSEAEFNSPFEEFSLLMEMRERSVGKRIRTNRPLGIYVPPEELELWQTGRSKSRITRKRNKYRDVELDILRQYILIYEWVDGMSADEALLEAVSDPVERKRIMEQLMERSVADMRENGFFVVDHKPAHIILRHRPDGTLLQNRRGEYPYALVDFELLLRTPEYESQVETARRKTYLEYQRVRFDEPEQLRLPEQLRPARVFGVDYVWGRAESTHGEIWVVGRRPELFDFFLPERWRHTPRQRLSTTAETFKTVSKDHIALVWKVSRVGETAAIQAPKPVAAAMKQHGYNSPFEEFALSMELASLGFSVVYPRAIYVAGLESPRAADYVTDQRRFRSHAGLKNPEGGPLLTPLHTYLTLWGWWRGRVDEVGDPVVTPCSCIDMVRAVERELITAEEQQRLLERTQTRLTEAGFETFLKPSHGLLSLDNEGRLYRDEGGEPSIALCNFELMHRLGKPGALDFPE